MLRWIYKNYRMGVFLIEGIVGAYAIFFLGPRGVAAETVLLILVLAAMPWLLAYNIANRQLNQKAMKAFNTDCDPGPMLDLADMTIRQFDRRGRSRRALMISWRLNRAAALCGLGRYQEALEELDHVQTRLGKRPGQLDLLYHNNRAAVYGGLKDVGAMSEEIQRALGLVAGLKLPTDLKDISVLSIRVNSCLLTALQEGYGVPELEEEYKNLREENGSVRWQVNARMGLAQCALARGDKVTAREHLRYVLDNGNKLIVREEAQALMDELDRI